MIATGQREGSRSPLGRTSLRDQRCGGKRCRHRCSIEQGRRAVWKRCHGCPCMPAVPSGSEPPMWMVTRAIRSLGPVASLTSGACGAGREACSAFRSVVSVLVRFVGRSFSTTSRPALRAACGRPPARQRHDGHRGTDSRSAPGGTPHSRCAIGVASKTIDIGRSRFAMTVPVRCREGVRLLGVRRSGERQGEE